LLIALYCAGRYLVIDSLRFEANDLSPIYVAARLVAEGKPEALYDRHPHLFNLVPPGAFKETAAQCGFKGTITPYVHLPLFAFLARPLTSIPFSATTVLVLVSNVIAVLVSLLLILKLSDHTSSLRWFCAAIVVLAGYYPLRYGLRLGQTSPMVFLGITSLYYLDRHGNSKCSGMLLGLIISLKITPILFLCHFLIKRRWSVVIPTILTMCVIAAASVLLVGWESNVAFLDTMLRLNGLSLASWNNQSIDGFLLRWVTGTLHLYDWHLLSLPPAIKAIQYLVLVCVGLLWLRMLLLSRNTRSTHGDVLAFSLTLIISVLFSPIAWTHYLLFLTFPYLILTRALMRGTQTPYRIWLLGGVVLSYVITAIPPPYLLLFLNAPVLHALPVTVVSSGGFLGGVLLLLIVMIVLLSQSGGKNLHHRG
jgi:hypothetical protein